MRRAIVVGIVTALLGVALVQERQAEGATLEVSTEPTQALVNVTGPQGFMAMLDLSGPESLTGLPAGKYYIVATADGHAVSQEELDLAEGADESVTLQLQPLSDGEEAGQTDESQQDQPGQQDQQQDDQQAQQQEGQQDQEDQVAGGGQAQGGEQVYQNQCAQCHGQQGEGGNGPALAENQNLQDAETVIGQILQGGGGMPAFGDQLSDEEIAAVASHEMSSWGNDFGEVTVDQVAQQRDGGQGQAGQQQEGQQQDGQQQQAQEGEQQDQQTAQGDDDGQAQDGQQDQQASGQPQVQVDEAGQATRVEITVPATGNAPVTLNLQLEIGAGGGQTAEAGRQSGQKSSGEQVAGGGQSQDQAQEQQQDQPAEDQPAEDQQQAGRQQDRSDPAGQGQSAEQDVQQGNLQIDWVEPAGATVTVTGPDGYSDQLQVIGGTVLRGLTPGSYTVTATLSGYESATEQVEVEAQETADVSLTLQQQRAQKQPEQEQPDAQQRESQNEGQQEGQQENQPSDGAQGDQQAQPEGEDQEQVAGGGQAAQQGDQVYQQQCAQCHGPDGEGGAGPALAGNEGLKDPQAVVTQILRGGGGMPAFGNQLSDDEVAAVATHEMNSWGNSFGEVTADQVAQQRDGGQQQDGEQQDGQQQEGQQQAGWFTAEQARRGMQEYAGHCAVCHGGGLQGRAAFPPVSGEHFLSEWQGRTAAELFEYISSEMPQDRPGQLGHLTYIYLTAYILDQNGFPAGQAELDPESGRLAELIIQGPSGEGGQQEGQPPAPVGEEPQQEEEGGE